MEHIPFTEFVKLSKEELIALNPILALIEQQQQDKVETEAYTAVLVNIIKNIDLGVLIRATFTYPKLDDFCKLPVLTPFWNERWRLSGRGHNPIDEEDINDDEPAKPHEYKPQVTLPTFDLLKGIYIYVQYKFNNTSENSRYRSYAHAYLKCAAQLGYFPALNAMYLDAFQAGKLDQALIYALRLAELYWTPGYLLLCLINYQADNYQEALLNLLVAEKLLPFSGAMINNAYQGDSIESILRGAGLNDLTTAKHFLAELSHLPMSYVTSSLYKQAKKITDNILQKFDKEEEVLNGAEKNTTSAITMQY
ncbi:DUF5630 domain-containing protein [Legionella parisiensis]|uniref:Uncharacterized protein n=1 Tax=Legionella parisiensis TaxID=45071 RepID=A0A1E5JLS2_9GAMM|nr:DUF5630 domain-containing protein [Legionella parisiensis]KTD41333.1 hypothetical protein Lpar_2650 [Legionella parisiensis]OEH45495.1 hypothetical protein lpari_03546 [Legionella parisiensis]STX76365.1 Uncharacterised protein [Legionella parisiensis]